MRSATPLWFCSPTSPTASGNRRQNVAPRLYAPIVVTPDWDVHPGEFLSREDRMRRFGGSKQNGIAPSGQSPNVFIYSDPSASNEFGYVEEWDEERQILHYTGDGQVGDQTFDSLGNRSIRDHKKDGRALRLFEADGTKPGSQEVIQKYVGRMEIDVEHPYSIRSGIRDLEGNPRSVIVFKLRRVVDETTLESDRPNAVTSGGDDADNGDAATQGDGEGVVLTVPVEKSNTEHFVAEYKALSRKERTRTEAKLQKKYKKYLESTLNRTVCRHRISIDGQVLYTDLFDQTTEDLIEVKSSVDRNTMRLALGQILDYSAIVKPVHRTLLLPERPAVSLVNLLQTHNIKIVWWDGESFETS